MNPVNQLVLSSLNHVIQGENWAQERLRQHAGATVLIEAGAITIRLSIDDRGLLTSSDTSIPPDVTVSLPADALSHAMFDREKLFSSVKLAGSADVAETFAFVFRNLRWDAEADLAQFLGDIPARRLNLLGHSLLNGFQDSIQKFAENLKEYAVEDSSLLVPPRDITIFGSEVNRIRDDIARLEKRISKL